MLALQLSLGVNYCSWVGDVRCDVIVINKDLAPLHLFKNENHKHVKRDQPSSGLFFIIQSMPYICGGVLSALDITASTSACFTMGFINLTTTAPWLTPACRYGGLNPANGERPPPHAAGRSGKLGV